MTGWGNHGWSVGTWVVMAVALVVFWTFVVAGLLALGIRLRHPRIVTAEPATVPATDAESILRERLTRGDINEDQFRRMIGMLRGS